MQQLGMEHSFWITLNSPYDSPDSLVHSLKVQYEGAP